MGFNVGGGSQQQSSRPAPILSPSPVVGVLSNLFGIPTVTSEGGVAMAPGFTRSKFTDPGVLGSLVEGHPGTKPKAAQFSGAAFAPGAGFENVGMLLSEPNIFGDLIGPLGGLGAAGAVSGLDKIQDAGSMLLENLETASQPVDVDPLVQQAMTDVREAYGPVTGGFSSDLEAEALRASSQLRVGAEERAADRALASHMLGGQIGTLGEREATQPLNTASAMLQLGELFGLSTATPQGRAVTTLQLLAGLQPTGAAERGAIQQSSGKSGSMGM